MQSGSSMAKSRTAGSSRAPASYRWRMSSAAISSCAQRTRGGAAKKAGLRPGDVIVEVGGEPAPTVDGLIVKTLTMKAGDTLRLTYERLGSSHTTVLTLAAGEAG